MRAPRSLAALAVLLMAAAPASAAPPEVANLAFESEAQLSWDAAPGAAGYHLYRGSISDLPERYGQCLRGSLMSTSASDPDEPAPGGAFFYLAAAFDPSGQGPVGFSSSGTPQVPEVACIPSRRCFELHVAASSDGASEVEPLRNAILELHAGARETVGVVMGTAELRVEVGPSGAGGADSKYWAFDIDSPPLVGTFAKVSGLKVKYDVVEYKEGGSSSFTHKIPRIPYRPTPVTPKPHVRGTMTAASGVRRELQEEQGRSGIGGGPTYRSRILYDGPLGHGWDFGANARLKPSGADVLWLDGTGRAFRFARTGPADFLSPQGLYAVLRQEPSGHFLLRRPDGLVRRFRPLDGSSTAGVLDRETDLSGNRISYLYDRQGLLETIVDHLGRSSRLAYDAQGRIVAATDHAGRTTTLDYDAEGHLVAITTPPVTGTPHGNDFPLGKTTRFGYSGGFADEGLNHNLVSITSPNEAGGGPASMSFTYVTSGAAFDLDRLDAWTIGSSSLDYATDAINPFADPGLLDLPRRRTTVVDRNGNQREYLLNASGHILQRTDFTNRGLRPAEPDHVTQYHPDAEGEVLEVLLPQGNRLLRTYDSFGADRYRRGNLLEARWVADAAGSGGRGDGHGGEAPDEVWSFTYEPLANHVASATEPRGNDPAHVPQNGGAWSPARYTTRWTYDYQEGDPALNGLASLASRFGISLAGVPLNLGDVNGDGTTLQAAAVPVKVEAPAVLLAPGSRQALIEGDTSQEAVALAAYDAHAQLTRLTDAEGNRHEMEYWPETDPDGDGTAAPPPDDGRLLDGAAGGYLRSLTLDTASAPGRDNGTDPSPVAARTDLSYDAAGNLASLVDGRGVRTTWVHNQLDQVVELRRASAVADSAGPHGDPATGRGESGLAPLGLRVRYSYDANGNLVRLEAEDPGATRGAGPFVETSWTYDLLDRPVTRAREAATGVALTTRYDYDANDNLVRVTRPEGNADDLAYDERDLLLSSTRGALGPRGGAPATRRYDYDGNGNLTRLTEATGGLLDYERDGLDRPARLVDQVGNTTDHFYDAAGNLVRALRRGPSGGPPPPDRSGSGNVDLADARLLYDERGRLFQEDHRLFVPAGVTTARPPVLLEGPLEPGDGFVNRRIEYDRLSRPTFDAADTGATVRLDYDGLGRLARRTDPDGSAADYTYDAAGNRVEAVVTEVSSVPGPPPAEFLTTWFHDALGRRTTSVNNAGETRRAAFDGLDAVVALTDARGPVTGAVNRRSPGHATIAVPINEHGNVSRYVYDAADRLVRTETVLTATGQGDGTLFPPPASGGPDNPDGLITTTATWDDNSLVASRSDDRGNTTLFSYDNLDRLIEVTGPDDVFFRYRYSEEGDLTGWTDGAGTIAIKIYNDAHQPVQTDITPAPGVEGPTGIGRQFDGKYLITKATHTFTSGGFTTTFTVDRARDALGRVVEERQGIVGSPDLVTDYAWRAEDQLAGLTYPSGRTIERAHDAAGRLEIVSDPSRMESARYEYFGMGRLHTRRYGNGVRSTRLNDGASEDAGSDAAGRLTLLRHLRPDNTLLAGFEYRRDRDGRVTSHRRLHDPAPPLDAQGEAYAYDSAGRLVQWQEGRLDPAHLPAAPPADSQAWSLDGAGNWVEFTRAGVVFRDTPNNNNEYDEPQSGGMRFDDGVPDDFGDPLATSFPDGLNMAHDRNGNRTFDGRRDLHYDGLDRLARAGGVMGPAVAEYGYDGLGRRVARAATLPGSPMPEERRYGYAGGAIVEERDGTGMLVRQAIQGPGPGGALWQVRADGSAQYFLEDAAGSTVAAVTAGSGPPAVLERVTYDAHGKPTFEDAANQPLLDPTGRFLAQSTVGNPDLFTGMRYDPELGVRGTTSQDDAAGNYWSGLRTYDPNQGRSLTRDPLGAWSRPEAAGNGYAVQAGDPVNGGRPGYLRHEDDYWRGEYEGMATLYGPGTGSLPVSGIDFDDLNPFVDAAWLRGSPGWDEGLDRYYDAHVHTIAEWFFDAPVNLFAPRKAYGGPIAMLAETALAGGAGLGSGSDHVFQHNQTDLEFVRARAARIGHEVSVVEEVSIAWFTSPGHHSNAVNPEWTFVGLFEIGPPIDLVSDAPLLPAPSRPYVPLILFTPSKGESDPDTYLKFRSASVQPRP